jgi:hypothetical protein
MIPLLSFNWHISFSEQRVFTTGGCGKAADLPRPKNGDIFWQIIG